MNEPTKHESAGSGARRRPRIPVAFWWESLSRNFDTVDREFIKRALAAEKEQTGHECGHRFQISVRSAGHSGIAGAGPESHSDAPYFEDDVPMVVEVRAHSLRDALLVAAALPFNDWFADEDEHIDPDWQDPITRVAPPGATS